MRRWATALVALVVAIGASGCTTVVRGSVSSSGTPGNFDSGVMTGNSISDDGRFVTFTSAANNLVADDTNSVFDVFRHDNRTGATDRVSVTNAEAQIPAFSIGFGISGDGDHIAFGTAASLEPGDTNTFVDVYVRNLSAGTTERVSLRPDGSSVNQGIFDSVDHVSISGDGRYVLMRSAPVGVGALYLRDRQTHTTTQLRDFTVAGLVSGNGQYVVTGTACDATSCLHPAAIRQLATPDWETISTTCLFSPTDISADGRYVVGDRGPLPGQQCPGFSGPYRWDRVTKEFAAIPTIGVNGEYLSVSDDGRFVGVADQGGDAYLVDMSTGSVRDAETDAFGRHGLDWTYGASLSADGRYLAMTSRSLLVPDDTNTLTDVYTRYAVQPSLESATPTSLARGANHAAVTVTGTAFLSGLLATVAGGGVTVHSATLQGPTSVVLDVSVAPGAAVGARNIVVSNAGGFGKSDGVCAGCLTIS